MRPSIFEAAKKTPWLQDIFDHGDENCSRNLLLCRRFKGRRFRGIQEPSWGQVDQMGWKNLKDVFSMLFGTQLFPTCSKQFVFGPILGPTWWTSRSGQWAPSSEWWMSVLDVPWLLLAMKRFQRVVPKMEELHGIPQIFGTGFELTGIGPKQSLVAESFFPRPCLGDTAIFLIFVKILICKHSSYRRQFHYHNWPCLSFFLPSGAPEPTLRKSSLSWGWSYLEHRSSALKVRRQQCKDRIAKAQRLRVPRQSWAWDFEINVSLICFGDSWHNSKSARVFGFETSEVFFSCLIFFFRLDVSDWAIPWRSGIPLKNQE